MLNEGLRRYSALFVTPAYQVNSLPVDPKLRPVPLNYAAAGTHCSRQQRAQQQWGRAAGAEYTAQQQQG